MTCHCHYCNKLPLMSMLKQKQHAHTFLISDTVHVHYLHVYRGHAMVLQAQKKLHCV